MWTETHKPTILVFGDATAILLLQNAQYNLIETKNAQETLELFKQFNPDLVLINIMDEPEQRLELLKEIKQLAPNIAQAILAICTPESALSDNAIEAGATEIIPYPIRASTLLRRVGNLLHYACIYIEANEQRMIADALTETAAALSSTLDLDKIFTIILENVRQFTTVDAANLMLIEGDHTRVVRADGYEGMMNDIITGKRAIPLSDRPIVQRMIQENRSMLTADTKTTPDWSPIPEDAWIGSNIVVPLTYRNVVLGLLSVDSAVRNRFTELDAQVLRAFADQAATAIHNARLYLNITNQTVTLEQQVTASNQELIHEQHRFQAIIDSMAEGVLMIEVTDQLKIRYINHAFTTMFGYTQHNILKNQLEIFKFPGQADVDYWEFVWNFIDIVREKGEVRLDTQVYHKDGTFIDVRLIATPLRDEQNAILGVVCVFEDTTEAKILEDKKKRFVANASHELRTPITNLKTRLYLLRRQPERQKEHIAVIEEVTDTIDRLAHDLLDLSRFERGIIPLVKRNFELQDLVAHVLHIQITEAEKVFITLKGDLSGMPIEIYADWQRLLQVVTNLVSNALQHTAPHGTVMVSVSSNNTYAMISVQDTGKGIPSQHLPHLFKPFYRVESKSFGTGLGLSISHEIVTMHDGEITVESELGKGTIFTVILPLSPAESDATPQIQHELSP